MSLLGLDEVVDWATGPSKSCNKSRRNSECGMKKCDLPYQIFYFHDPKEYIDKICPFRFLPPLCAGYEVSIAYSRLEMELQNKPWK